jgi:hypothetical protein
MFAQTAKNKVEPARIAITGAAGQVGYSVLFRIARYFYHNLYLNIEESY